MILRATRNNEKEFTFEALRSMVFKGISTTDILLSDYFRHDAYRREYFVKIDVHNEPTRPDSVMVLPT